MNILVNAYAFRILKRIIYSQIINFLIESMVNQLSKACQKLVVAFVVLHTVANITIYIYHSLSTTLE